MATTLVPPPHRLLERTPEWMPTTRKKMPPAGPPASNHLAYLDGLRALAALFVVVHHILWPLNFAGASAPGLPHAITRIFWFGHFAVDLFIVLSGFCLALPVVRGDGQLTGGVWKFFGKRARRILPTYYLALGFSLLLIWLAIGHKTGTLWDFSLPITAKDVLAHLFLVQDMSVQTNYKINAPFWSISVEWRIYFLFPLLVILRRRFGAFWVAIGAIIVSYAALYVGQNTGLKSLLYLDNGGMTPQYLGLFAMGMLAADIACGKQPLLPLLRHPRAAAALLLVGTLLLLAVSRFTFRHGDILPVAYADFFVGLWSVSLLIAAANAEIVWLHKILSWKPLVFVGTFAYSIYLVHEPLIQLLWQYAFVPLHSHPTALYLALCFVGVPLIVGASYLFYLACERPFLNRRKRETIAEAERNTALSPAL